MKLFQIIKSPPEGTSHYYPGNCYIEKVTLFSLGPTTLDPGFSRSASPMKKDLTRVRIPLQSRLHFSLRTP